MTMTTMHPLAKFAAADLGRKAAAMTTTSGGTTIAEATNGETWVEVAADAAADDAHGASGSIAPRPERADDTAGALLCGRDLRRIMDGIVPATDTETSRYALGGTLVEIAEGAMLAVVATDGRRLHAGHLQPAAIHGQAAPIVHADQWRALDAAIRATVRGLCGAAGRRIDAIIDRGSLWVRIGTHKPTGSMVVTLEWESAAADTHGRAVAVRAHAVAVAGRFPPWRELLPENAPEAFHVGPRQTLTIDAPAVAAAVGEFSTLHRAAERAAKAADKVERAEAKARRRWVPEFRFDRGIDCGPAGMAGCGITWAETVPACPVSVKLDQRYLADALAAAAAWGGRMVEVSATDKLSAVALATGECGPRVVAVIMPMAAD